MDVARKCDLTHEKVRDILDRWVMTKVNWDEFERIEVVELDEIALKGGHRDYIVLVSPSCPGRSPALGAPGREREKGTVTHFLDSIPIRLKETIK